MLWTSSPPHFPPAHLKSLSLLIDPDLVCWPFLPTDVADLITARQLLAKSLMGKARVFAKLHDGSLSTEVEILSVGQPSLRTGHC